MFLNPVFELSMMLDNDHFQKIIDNKAKQLSESEDGYIDLSMGEKGIAVIYRNSRYKKKIRLLVDTCLATDDPDDTDRLIRKLGKRIDRYFNHKYCMDDFVLSGINLIADIDVGSGNRVSAYLKVLQRVGKVKGFSPASYNGLAEKSSFCLSGNSNGIDFLLYDLEGAIMEQLHDVDKNRSKIQSVGNKVRGVLRAEVRLTKPKVIQEYTDATNVSGQIMELAENCQRIFLDTFARVVPYGDFHKKEAAVEIIRREVKDGVIRRKMLRLVALIPEKKSLYLAHKAMNCRNVEKVMGAFAKINLSPVTISKRHDVKHLESVYSFF